MTHPDVCARSEKLALAAILIVFAAFATIHARRLPAFEGPDEPGNLQYVQFVAIEGRLARPSLVPTHELEVLSRGILPPLWFVALAPLVRAKGADEWRATTVVNPHFLRRAGASDGGVGEHPTSRLHFLHGRDDRRSTGSPALRHLFLLRLTSIPAACLAILAVWRAARLVAPAVVGVRSRAAFALGAAGLAAATPQFQHLAGALTMDLWVGAFGSLAIASAARWIAAPSDARRWWASPSASGAWAGLAGLTKLNGLVVVVALAIAPLFSRSRARMRIAALSLCALACVAIAGPWYSWGALETGHPLWIWHYQTISPFHNPTGTVPQAWSATSAYAFVLVLAMTWFGNFGWTSVWFPLPITVAFVVAATAATASACALALRASRRTTVVATFGAVAVASWVAVNWVGPWYDVFAGSRAIAYGALAVVGTLVLVATRLVPHRPRADGDDATGGRVLAYLVACGALILAAEVAFNLRFSQPQARHMYPFLPALVVPLAAGLARMRLLLAACVASSVASIGGLVLVEERLRPPGFDDSALIHVTDALRRGNGTAALPAPAWVAPAHDSVLVDAPTLVFESPGAMHEIVIGVRNPELSDLPWREGPLLFRTARDAGIRLPGPRAELAIPPALWASLADGDRLDAVVLALDEDGREASRSAIVTVRKGR